MQESAKPAMRLLLRLTESRTTLAVIATIAQVAWFFALSARPIEVLSDNIRYEVPGYNLSHGNGFSFSDKELRDDTVRGWACAHSGLGCRPSELYPAAAYPPGYSIFVAGIYSIFGRSLTALWLSQGLLLLLLCAMFYSLAARLLSPIGQTFVFLVLSAYPFIARHMGIIMSDGLHLVLWFSVAWVAVAVRPGLWRGIALGTLAAAAVMTRPYALVCLPFMLAPGIRRTLNLRHKELIAVILAGLLVCAPWWIRNGLVFGRFIPFSAAGAGLGLVMNEIEAEVGSARLLDADTIQRIETLVQELGDPHSVDVNRALSERALAWIRSHPDSFALRVVARLPRYWISQGYSGQGAHRLAPVLMVTMGALMVLGFLGYFLRRHSGHFQLLVAMTIPYWLFLTIFPVEARRTLPLRLFLLLGAGAFIEAAFKMLTAPRLTQPSR